MAETELAASIQMKKPQALGLFFYNLNCKMAVMDDDITTQERGQSPVSFHGSVGSLCQQLWISTCHNQGQDQLCTLLIPFPAQPSAHPRFPPCLQATNM